MFIASIELEILEGRFWYFWLHSQEYTTGEKAAMNEIKIDQEEVKVIGCPLSKLLKTNAKNTTEC